MNFESWGAGKCLAALVAVIVLMFGALAVKIQMDSHSGGCDTTEIAHPVAGYDC